MMRSLWSGHRQRGFTLLELMLSLLLLSMLMIGIGAALETTRRLVRGGTVQARRDASIWSTQRLLRQSLSQMRMLSAGPGEALPDWAPAGTARGLRYLAPLALASGGDLLQRLQLVASGKGDLQLQLQIAPRPAGDARPQWRKPPYILLEDIESGHFEYLVSEASMPHGHWVRAWPTAGPWPRLIALDLRLKKAPAWPRLVVRPRLVGDAAAVAVMPASGQLR